MKLKKTQTQNVPCKIIGVVLLLLLNAGQAFASYNDDILFVTITSRWCSTCKKIKPVIEDLKWQYDGQLTFITLNTGSKEDFEESERIAEENGIKEFFEENKHLVPSVSIICKNSSKANESFIGETRKEIFTSAIEKSLNQSSEICSLPLF